jgi:hypothetical protein
MPTACRQRGLCLSSGRSTRSPPILADPNPIADEATSDGQHSRTGGADGPTHSRNTDAADHRTGHESCRYSRDGALERLRRPWAGGLAGAIDLGVDPIDNGVVNVTPDRLKFPFYRRCRAS